MAIVSLTNTSIAVNPLKQSQTLGAALAFLGCKGTMTLLHGSQGCAALTKVGLERHLGAAVHLSTTSMTEVATVLGGEENVETAILNLVEKYQPQIIGLCTTGLMETRGDDMGRFLKEIRHRHPELDYLPIVLVSTPDFKGALQDGFAAAVESLVKIIPQTANKTNISAQQVTVLVSSALTPADVLEIEEIIRDFGLNPIIIPHLGASLSKSLADYHSAITTTGTTLEQLRAIANSVCTLAFGESMRNAARILRQKFSTPYQVFHELSGLNPTDRLLKTLVHISGNQIPEKYRQQRRQLENIIFDIHPEFGCKRVSLALEPDLLWSMVNLMRSLSMSIHATVTTTRSPLLEELPTTSVTIGDLEDFELLSNGADLLIANSYADAISQRLQIPLYRMGIPICDRIGYGYFPRVAYRGTIQLLFDIGNLLRQETNKINRIP